MRDPFSNRNRRSKMLQFLEMDAWVDSSLFNIGRAIRQGYESYSTFMFRFHVAGFRRFIVELFSDGLTFGTAGAVLMLMLAIPAFDETYDAWRANTEYSVTFTDRYGNEIGKRGVLHNDSVPLEEIPINLLNAVMSTEDRRFFQHLGIDFIGLARAITENLRASRVVQGGSTLTQQLAKNLFLTPERTLQRKIKEAFLAIWLEARLTKREILKLYLDRAYLGGGTRGVDAAAEFYFGKSVRDISLSEAAMLAGLFKAPTKYAPHANLPAARARANEVLQNMVEANYLTAGEIFAAQQNPAIVVDRSEVYLPNYFLDWAYSEVTKLGNGKDFVLTVRTTVDLELQKAAEAAIASSIRENVGRFGNNHQASMVVVEHDGAVRAMVGGRDYGESQFNRAADGLRQPGSSFKPFVYMAALMNGYSPKSVVYDGPITIGGWSPKNYTRSYKGPVSLTLALQKSINTIPVKLAQAIGRDKIKETAHKMGIRSSLPITRAMPLGVAEVTALDMAAAYAVIANGGKEAPAHGILEIRNTAGELIYDRDNHVGPPEQILPAKKVEQLNYMLSHVIEHGTARSAQLDFTTAAGKTGTTQAYRDAWFIGYTGKYSAAVWYGNDDFTSTRRMTGGSLPAITWKSFMDVAHRNANIAPLVGAIDPRGVLKSNRVNIARNSAQSDDDEFSAQTSAMSPKLNDAIDTLHNLFEIAEDSDVKPIEPVANLGPDASQNHTTERIEQRQRVNREYGGTAL